MGSNIRPFPLNRSKVSLPPDMKERGLAAAGWLACWALYYFSQEMILFLALFAFISYTNQGRINSRFIVFHLNQALFFTTLCFILLNLVSAFSSFIRSLATLAHSLDFLNIVSTILIKISLFLQQGLGLSVLLFGLVFWVFAILALLGRKTEVPLIHQMLR
jgi:hypothetical protein